jgi:hypothetical protein
VAGDDDIELVAVHHKELPTVGHPVDGLADHGDPAELHVDVVAQRLVVIAGDIDDAGSLARLPQ